MECGGKRSATPPWIGPEELNEAMESGVALRLPPHSKKTVFATATKHDGSGKKRSLAAGAPRFLFSWLWDFSIFDAMTSARLSSVHFVGICGTAMASAAAAMQEKGVKVTGSDQNVYPPMSAFLAERRIQVMEGYAERNL